MIALAPRAELQQASVRLAIGISVLVYMGLRLAGPLDTDLLNTVWLLAGFVAIAVGIIVWILARPQDAPARLILGIIADNGAITYVMLQLGKDGVLFFGIYLFVAFGNAFRYGAPYSRISHVAALLGFTIVLFTSAYWSRHPSVGSGLFTSLIVLPMYVGRLAERVKAEWRRAEQELKECHEALRECGNRERGQVLK